jgi:hypothetical protein
MGPPVPPLGCSRPSPSEREAGRWPGLPMRAFDGLGFSRRPRCPRSGTGRPGRCRACTPIGRRLLPSLVHATTTPVELLPTAVRTAPPPAACSGRAPCGRPRGCYWCCHWSRSRPRSGSARWRTASRRCRRRCRRRPSSGEPVLTDGAALIRPEEEVEPRRALDRERQVPPSQRAVPDLLAGNGVGVKLRPRHGAASDVVRVDPDRRVRDPAVATNSAIDATTSAGDGRNRLKY